MEKKLIKENYRDDVGYLAFIDALGFKALVYGQDSSKKIQKYIETVDQILGNKLELQYVVFSDSIIIVTKDDTEQSFNQIIKACSNLFWALLKEKIPVRGAIAFGSNHYKESFVAGRPLIEAAEFEKRQNWVGISLCSSAVKKNSDRLGTQEISPESTLREDPDLAPYLEHYYSIPVHREIEANFEEGNSLEGYAIRPSDSNNQTEKIQTQTDYLYKILCELGRCASDPKTQLKYFNTAQFIRR